VEPVLDGPVLTDGPGGTFGVGCEAGDVQALLDTGLALEGCVQSR
jgi:hypothetical protein